MRAVETVPGETLPITHTVFLPAIYHDFTPLAYRMGYGLANTTTPDTYPDVRTLRAGWYTNWGASASPSRPGGIEYVQMIRVHQKIVDKEGCGKFHEPNRGICPYATPLDYVYYPDAATIATIAQAQPGSIWLIGNEMDRVDFAICTEWNGSNCVSSYPSGQDEMLPETYAKTYHDLYQIVKQADPTAKVAVGGLIQPTPLRLQWLTIAWDTYQKAYTQTMPVDIWNIHNFVLREAYHEYGADIPPGLPGNPQKGMYTTDDSTHVDRAVFAQQIRSMRQWMKDRGQQQKPLIITEYGVLYSHCVKFQNGVCKIDLNNAQNVHDFMLWTFDYFANTKDCTLGYEKDECRLVQRWLWFALDHGATNEAGELVYGANPHASFYDARTKSLFPAGEKVRAYVESNFAVLSKRWEE